MTVEELEKPEVWSFARQKGFRVHDRVEVMAKNGSQLSFGIVTYMNGNDIRVQIFQQYDLHEQKANEIEYNGFSVRFVSNEEQWCIFDKRTGSQLKGNMPTDQACIKYLRDHLKALNQG